MLYNTKIDISTINTVFCTKYFILFDSITAPPVISETLIIVLSVLGGVAVIIFLLVLILACYCTCCSKSSQQSSSYSEQCISVWQVQSARMRVIISI